MNKIISSVNLCEVIPSLLIHSCLPLQWSAFEAFATAIDSIVEEHKSLGSFAASTNTSFFSESGEEEADANLLAREVLEIAQAAHHMLQFVSSYAFDERKGDEVGTSHETPLIIV